MKFNLYTFQSDIGPAMFYSFISGLFTSAMLNTHNLAGKVDASVVVSLTLLVSAPLTGIFFMGCFMWVFRKPDLKKSTK